MCNKVQHLCLKLLLCVNTISRSENVIEQNELVANDVK